MIASWLAQAQLDRKSGSAREISGFVVISGEAEKRLFEKILASHALPWQKSSLKKNDREVLHFVGRKGPVWILRPKNSRVSAAHGGLLDESPYARLRDQLGSLVPTWKTASLQRIEIEFHGTSREQELGALTALDIAAYGFREEVDGKSLSSLPKLILRKPGNLKIDRELVARAQARARAVNTARHLVNLPPNDLNPVTFTDLVRKQKAAKGLSIEIWDEKRLKKEGMGLHLGVGQGSATPPRLVHLRWRPGTSTGLKPVAFVGKGITFDTGGLDIKPSSGMRLMKKDMGGAAAVFAVFAWAVETKYAAPLDAYLALAENAVDAAAFRPSDVLTARSGLKVEIDNTDAEGRLVLADAMDVAVTQKGANEPEIVIDVATLTGAIKVALGADIAGLFSNDDSLAESLSRAGQLAGDLNWRMPLMEKYAAGLSSAFADCRNSTEGFGGAITAALFLQKFVRSKRWAHLDVYAWTDKVQGPLGFAGGSGQPVQALIEWLEARV